MRQSELDRAVARATGESIRRVRRAGFVLVPAPRRRGKKKPAAVQSAWGRAARAADAG